MAEATPMGFRVEGKVRVEILAVKATPGLTTTMMTMGMTVMDKQ